MRRALLEFEGKFAEAFGRRLPVESTHVVVSLSLLPHLWREGWLGGRTFVVLADRLPISVTQSLLDDAFARHPDRGLLADFRAPEEIVRAEGEALDAADQIVTPNSNVAALFGERAFLLPWSTPAAGVVKPGESILFPGPTAARKGAYEVREAARRLGLRVVLTGNELEGPDFWQGIETVRRSPGEPPFDDCFAVVQPAVVEEQPRMLLAALASGIPVITTAVCGLGQHANVKIIPPGDADALVSALRAIRP